MRTILAGAMALLLACTGAMAGSKEDLDREQDRVERHLLRVQQERFEASARGEDARTLKRLDREFKRTYGRRNVILEEQKNAQ